VDSAATTSPTQADLSAARNRLAQTAAYYAAFIGLGLGIAALGPTLPGLAQHTRTHLSGISFPFTAHNLGYLVGSLAAGQVYDRVRGHPVMAGVLVILAAMMFLIPLMPLLWLLMAAVFVLGVGGGLVDVGANTLLVWVHRDAVAPYMNGLHFFFGVGALLAPVIIAQLVLMSGDITWAYWVLALFLLPAAVWLLRLPSPVSLVESRGDTPVRTNHLLVGLVVLLFVLYVGAEYSMGGYIYTYAVATNLATTTTAAYLTSMFWGSFTLGRLLGIPISMRVRPRYILFADFAVCMVGIGAILLWPTSATVLWAGVVVTGLGMASVFPVIISFAGRRMTITGRITGWFFVGVALGGMTLPWLIGQLFEPIGPSVAMVAMLSFLGAALCVLVVILQMDRSGHAHEQA
jgi:MFS transporter, FHS family, Na+ dependent glucose transporter 1